MADTETTAVPQQESIAAKKAEAAEVVKKAAEAAEAAESPDVAVEAINLLSQGKRNMLVGEIPQACNQLQEACRLLASKYGETGEECAESYLLYGKALLELSRMESGVLGNALQGIEEEEKSEDSSDEKTEDSDKLSVEEKEKISEDVIDAMLERDGETKKQEWRDKR